MRHLSIIFLLAFTCCKPPREKLTVAVAANLQYTMQALVEEFNKTDNTTVEVVTGASGKLTQQIMNGAPFDIFVSADKEFPQRLADHHFTQEPPKVYAQGLLVLWSTRPGIRPSKDLALLKGPQIKHIALANPATAPYGSAAQWLLKKYGLYDSVRAKLVTGESITQATQFIATGSADIGFTAKSMVVSGEMKGKGSWAELDAADYPPIEQAAALLEHARQHQEAATRFYNFLFSDKAKAIFKQFGYIVQ